MKNINLSNWKKPTKTFLKKPTNPSLEVQEVLSKPKKEKKIKEEDIKDGVRGRPLKEDEPLNKSITFLVTESELKKIDERAGMIPRGGFLRESLKKAGVFN